MQFTFKATKRAEQGTGASRRLRRAGVIPAIIYGQDKDATQISLDHNELFHLLRNETFHSSVLNIDVEGNKETVILRNTQWHPFRQIVMHMDFQRIDPKQKLHIKVPLHFINGDICPGVKLQSGLVSHVMNDIEIQCLPADLPEFIEADLKELAVGHSLHASQLALPKGVELALHTDADPVVATVAIPRAVAAAESEAAAASGAGEATPPAA